MGIRDQTDALTHSSLDIEGVDLGLSMDEIVTFVREVRQREPPRSSWPDRGRITRMGLPHAARIRYSCRNKDWVCSWPMPEVKAAGLTVCIDHESFEHCAPSLTEYTTAVNRSGHGV